jgi:hypothetical protein
MVFDEDQKSWSCSSSRYEDVWGNEYKAPVIHNLGSSGSERSPSGQGRFPSREELLTPSQWEALRKFWRRDEFLAIHTSRTKVPLLPRP